MYCRYCGKKIADDSKFCNYCGKPQEGQSVPLSTEVTDDDIANGVKDEYGVAYSRDGRRLLKCGNEELIQYTVKEGTKVICDKAFYDCKMLKTIRLPEGLTTIGERAFYLCWLVSIVLPESLREMKDNPFVGSHAEITSKSPHFKIENELLIQGNRIICVSSRKPTSIKIPDYITSIGESAFDGCDNQTSIKLPDGLTDIGKSAFYGCYNLLSIELPDSVTNIGDEAFIGCWMMKSIRLPNSVTEIGINAFKYCKNLEKVYIRCVAGVDVAAVIEKFKKLLPKELHKKIEIVGKTANNIKNKEMRYLFFDTETTGVPRNYNAPSSDTGNWPRLVQISWIGCDERGNVMSKEGHIIRPEGFTIPEKASRVHRITTERALAEGERLSAVLDKFEGALRESRCIVCHNVNFDKRVVGAELIRLGRADSLRNKESICTMERSTNFCAIPGMYGYKYPKLQELYYKLFNSSFENGHDSMADIEATFKCFWELKRRNIL